MAAQLVVALAEVSSVAALAAAAEERTEVAVLVARMVEVA